MPATKKMKAEFSVRTQQFKVNKLLNRKQFVVVVNHQNWNGTVPTKAIVKKLAQLYKVPDENQVAVFGMKSQFGGGKSTGFACIYDDLASMKRYEPNYRLVRLGMGRARGTARKSLKEKKNRALRFRGKDKATGKKK